MAVPGETAQRIEQALGSAQLAERMSSRRLAQGEELFTFGAPGPGLCVVIEGRFEVLLQVDGETLSLGKLGPGSVLGEIQLVDGKTSTATVRATVDSSVMVMDPDSFQRLVLSYPEQAGPLLDHLTRTLATRLRRTGEGVLSESEDTWTIQTEDTQRGLVERALSWLFDPGTK